MILRPGLQGPYIAALQRRLNANIAENSIPTPILTVDGQYGPATKTAVEAYQRAAGIAGIVPEAGHLDDVTRDALNLPKGA